MKTIAGMIDVCSWNIPVVDVRKGDRLLCEDGTWRLVSSSRVRSHRYDDGWKDFLTIQVMKSESEWDWSKYDTYGYQLDDDYYGRPEKFLPEDCMIEYLYDVQSNEMVEITNDSPQILDPETLTPMRWYAVVYEVDRAYGGPEEGGWYYSTGQVVHQVICSTEHEADTAAEKLEELFPNNGTSSSVMYAGGDYRVSVQKSPGKDYPENRPYYC